MKQLLKLLFVSLVAGLWLSLEEANCHGLDKGMQTMSYCYNTSSGKTCFTTFLANNNRAVRKSFKQANLWCNSAVPGSSLIIINSPVSQSTADSFIGRQVLANETIIMDARKLSARDSLTWSWVNGHPIIPKEKYHEGACVELKRGQSHGLAYCFAIVRKQYRYICEYSDSRSDFSYRQNNKSYVVSKNVATWYDARKECLHLEGDLASITDFREIMNRSWLKEDQKYWIGLHQNKWIWNSTGAAITYTNWNNGFPEESPDTECICISPQCRGGNDKTKCEMEYDRKWRTCNCNNSYAIVCHKEDAASTEIAATEELLPSTSADFKSFPSLPVNYTTKFYIRSSSSLSPSTGPFSSFHIKTLLIPLSALAVAFIIVAVILIIRKRKYDIRNEGSPMKNTKQSETVSSVYATVVPVNRPSVVTVPPGNTIYTDVEMTQRPTPSNNTIYASIQPTCEADDMGKSVVYADLDLQKKDQQKPRNAEKTRLAQPHLLPTL